MKSFTMGISSLKILAIGLLVSLPCAVAADNECPASGEYSFVCGPQNAEDLVLVPGTNWIIASGMAPGASIYLVDTQQKTWSGLYPANAPLARQDMKTYGACPGSPDPNNFISHGLNIRAGADGYSTLYVVGHGGREAIEVFDVDASGERPILTWTGCVMTPEGLEANSVASFSDGSLVATIPLLGGKTISDAMVPEPTGAIFRWSPGDSEFTRIQGTDLPYGNGIEVSADGQEIYVVSSGLFKLVAFSNSNPARQLRSTEPMEFVPDNLHLGSDGKLITAGLVVEYPVCGNVRSPDLFNLEQFATCPRPFIVSAIDPKTLDSKVLARGPANEHFSNITMALPVGEEIWIGTFAGDRIAYKKQ